ncbi:MAG: hypothetical protein VR65_21815 [Desulfobulbaceae bacterium BRH_c16a]|nr:MAG: hypothetical protein VR65_21815 [Desulfobulbaceae bacterium BRH_c16a]
MPRQDADRSRSPPFSPILCNGRRKAGDRKSASNRSPVIECRVRCLPCRERNQDRKHFRQNVPRL